MWLKIKVTLTAHLAEQQKHSWNPEQVHVLHVHTAATYKPSDKKKQQTDSSVSWQTGWGIFHWQTLSEKKTNAAGALKTV